MKSEAIHRRIRKLENDERWFVHRYKLANEEYHLCKNAVSSSALKELYYGKNPSLCYQKYIKKTIPFKQTEAMVLGSAAHKFILERRSFKKEFAVFRGGFKRGKIWETFKEEHPNREIITATQYDDIQRMSDAVYANKDAEMLLTGGMAEQSCFWRDDQTGLLCRARADYKKVTPGGSTILVDLKTCISAEPSKFTKQICNMGYPIQSSMYSEGFQAQAFAFIAVEKGPHITVQVYELSPTFDEIGYLQYRQAMEKWELYLRTNHWPTYVDKVTTLEPPAWLEAQVIGA